MFHDPNVYDDPSTFNPDRFIENEFGVKAGVPTEDRRNNFAFGAGRVRS